MNPIEVLVLYTNAAIMELWVIYNDWQRVCNNFLGDINNKYVKSKQLQFTKRTGWILPCTVKRTPVSAALTFYTEADELGMAGYKAGNSSKVIQSPYSSVKKSELYTILIVLLNFNDSLNMIIDSQHRRGCITYRN